MDEITTLTALQLLQLIRDGKLSAVEALEAHLQRVHNENPRLNAVITLDEEGALTRAREADEAFARGQLLGALHGLPMTLKDGHSTAGMRTTAGYEPLKDYVPTDDGTVAARLKAAGAIIFGKTNVSPLLGDIQANNPIFGRTNNPYNISRTPGGSSGGAAAALATGMTPLEVGSDYAGSIRIPAAFCGVYGLKTTEHRVSMWGHIPDIPGRMRKHRKLWSIGPMARSLQDILLCFNIIAGPDGKDMDVPPVALSATDNRQPTTRVAFATTFPGVPVERAIHDAIVSFAAKLEAAKMQVAEALPLIDFKELAQQRLILSRAVMDDTDLPSLEDYLHALDARDRITRTWEAFFNNWDALIAPVSMTTAFPHCETGHPILVDGEPVNYWRSIGHCAPLNFTGQPVVTIPVGRDPNGLPIGIQVIGKRWSEHELLALAHKIDQIANH